MHCIRDTILINKYFEKRPKYIPVQQTQNLAGINRGKGRPRASGTKDTEINVQKIDRRISKTISLVEVAKQKGKPPKLERWGMSCADSEQPSKIVSDSFLNFFFIPCLVLFVRSVVLRQPFDPVDIQEKRYL